MEKEHSDLIQPIKNLFFVLLGNTLYALGVVLFILPNGLITGGTTGLALIAQYSLGIPLTGFVTVFNTLMFLIGWWALGRKFALTTLVSSFYYPFILEIFQRIPSLRQMTNDRLLSAIYAGLLIGLAIGIVIRAGASTGGMDIPPLTLNKKLGLPVSVTMYAFDFSILLGQMLFADREQVLYGILLVLIYTAVLDKVLLFGHSRTQVKIVSKEYEAINQVIIRELDRGSTLLHGETGYLRESIPVVLTVLSDRELPRLTREVSKIDPKAFLVISKVKEAQGRGFTMKKVYRQQV